MTGQDKLIMLPLSEIELHPRLTVFRLYANLSSEKLKDDVPGTTNCV